MGDYFGSFYMGEYGSGGFIPALKAILLRAGYRISRGRMGSGTPIA